MAQTAALLDSDTQQFKERRRALRTNLLPTPTEYDHRVNP